MSKRKKKRPTASAMAKSQTVSNVDAGGIQTSFWRGLASEPIALGLALFVVLRPWRDGLTFTAFNAYFFAVVLVLAAVWCARGVLRPASLRSPVPLAIFAVFLGTAWLTGFKAYSYDPEVHGLQRLAIYFLLFVLATNGVRTRRAVVIVLAAIVGGWLINSVWTIFHYNVMLKGMRQVLKDNPQVMLQYFGTMEPTRELKDRIESNRAFGTFLFPNALGAYLILGVPILAALLPNAGAALRSLRGPHEAPKSPNIALIALGLGIAVAVAALTVLYFGNEFIGLARPGQVAPIPGAYRPFLYFLPVAVAVGAAAGWFVRLRGATAFGTLCLGTAIPMALIVSLIALWLSFSRGSMIAMALASAIAALVVRGGRLPWRPRLIRAGVASTLLAAALIVSHASGAQDQNGYRIPDPLPTYVGYEQRKYDESIKESHTLNIEGSKRELGSLGNLASFRIRVTYWQVGMKMFVNNFWTGVGLGNFQTAYPKYQFLGAGDVETAHNDYLQYFCETGVFGGSLFLAFWVYFGVWGARRILEEPDTQSRRWLAGIYAGALGFAFHSTVDFDFQNPSLAMEAYVIAGLFFAFANAASEEPEERAGKRMTGRIAAVALGVIVLVCTSSIVRSYLFDLGFTENSGFWRLWAVGDRKPMKARLETANLMWDILLPKPDKPAARQFVFLGEALRVVPDLTLLQSVTELRASTTEAPWTRRLRPDETPNLGTIVVFTDLPRAKQIVTEGCERKIAVLAEWDKAYPYDPEVASHLFSWYDMLYENAPDPAAQRRYALEAERWSKAAVDRSPQLAWWWLNYAKAMWMRGRVESGKTGVEYYRTGLGYYRKAHELYPRSAMLTAQYGEALRKLGVAMVKAGSAKEGAEMLEESKAMGFRAAVLDHYNDLIR